MGKNSKLLFFYKLTLIFMLIGISLGFFIKKPNEKSLKIKQPSYKEIKLRDLSDLSGLKKEEIYKKRTQYVLTSPVFSYLKNYSPDPMVYNFEDKLGWISLEQIVKYGMKDNKNITKGPSRSSLAINNPELLLSLIAPDYSLQKDKKAFFEADCLLPKKLLWDEENKTLKAIFDIKTFYEKNPSMVASAMFIDETNARDLGFNWMQTQSQKNIRFQNPQKNIRIRPYKPLGRYQKGTSCAIKEGCNNYSPYQEELVFAVVDLPSELVVKFWRNKPSSIRQEADIKYIMAFE